MDIRPPSKIQVQDPPTPRYFFKSAQHYTILMKRRKRSLKNPKTADLLDREGGQSIVDNGRKYNSFHFDLSPN